MINIKQQQYGIIVVLCDSNYRAMHSKISINN